MKKTFIVLFLSGIFLSVFIYKKFQIEKLIIISDKPKLNGVAIFDSGNLLFIDERKSSFYLQKQNPQVKSIVIEKKFPQTVILQVESRIPVAKIGDDASNLYIDNEGVILTNEVNFTSLPKIRVLDFEVYKNQQADWRMVKISLFIEITSKQGILVDQIFIDNASSSFTVQTKDGIQILLPFDTDVAAKASSLQVILQRFKIVGKNITRIDFRFDKPLVTLTNGEKISSTF